MSKEIQVRNTTANFLIFVKENNAENIDVRIEDKDVWLTVNALCKLYGKSKSTITEHIKTIFATKEQDENAVVRNFRTTASDGKEYNVKHYNLAMIISIGYRVNSEEAISFRKWATEILKTFTIQGYVLDKDRLENGKIFDEEYFDHLLEEIQEIRASERKFYQKITDIYATASDYDSKSYITREFFQTVQNKLYFAVHGNTAPELILKRANHEKENMVLTSWKNAPDGKILKRDVSIAKNYLLQLELKDLNEIVSMYLDYATRQARRKIPVTMADWSSKLDTFLQLNDEQILTDKGQVKKEISKTFAESEYEKYRVIQDSKYVSDFDKLLLESE